MSLTPEEISQLPEEVQAKIRELQQSATDAEAKSQRLQIEKDAAENLLQNVDFRGRNTGPSATEQNPRDSAGNANFGNLIGDASKTEVDSTAFEAEVDEAAKQILSRFTDEQMQDPNAVRAAIAMFGKSVGSLAFKRAFQHSINVFQKAVNMKANIDAIIAQWRIDNPDLANDKQSEDLVEFFLMKKVIVDPRNKAKQLPELLGMATDMAREYLKSVRTQGVEEGRRESETVVPLTLRPGNRGGNGKINQPKKQEEEPMTQEDAAERFLAMRSKMAQKTAWTGRPS